MQEEVEMRAVSLSITTAKFTGNVLKSAIAKVLHEAQNKQSSIKHGKMSVKELTSQDAGASSMEVTSLRVRSFDKVARKYGVDYAIYKDKSTGEKNKYLIFFKGRDADAVTAAFNEYAAKDINRETKKPSIIKKLHEFSEKMVPAPAEKKKELVR